MTQQVEASMGNQANSILVVSRREAFAKGLSKALPADGKCSVTVENSSFETMNGSASDTAFDFDVVVFDANVDDAEEVQAIGEVLSHRSNDTVFLAVTDAEVSIAKARRLREIGVDEVLPSSISEASLKEVIDQTLDARRASHARSGAPEELHGGVIAVAQARGGIGSTTVAVNLAGSLVGRSSMFRKGHKRKVALLDLDVQFGNANVFLDLEDNGGFLQLIESVDVPDMRFLKGVMQTHPLGIDVLCAPLQVVPLSSLRPEILGATLDVLRRNYEYVIVDLPRVLVDWIEPVLSRATQLVIVSDTSVPSIRQARRLMDFYREDHISLPVEIIVNREKRPLLKSEHIRDAEKVLEKKLTHWLPDNPKLARKAVDLGRPVVEFHPRSDLGKAMAKLATAVVSSSQARQARV